MDSTTILRSNLQYSCQSLSNLTINDLAECKWTTRKLVFTELLSNCASVREEFEKLLILIENRDNEMRTQRRSNESREKRAGSEQQFRIIFMGIVLDSLNRLQWPPCLEAFSNPLHHLNNDIEGCKSAMSYILGFCKNPPPMEIPASVSKSPENFTVRKSSATNSRDPLSPRLNSSELHASELQGDYEIIQDHHALCQALQICQSHNEVLSKQLKILQDSINARNDCELKLEALLADLQTAVDDIVGTVAPGLMPAGETEQTAAEAWTSSGADKCTSKPSKLTPQPIGKIRQPSAATGRSGDRRKSLDVSSSEGRDAGSVSGSRDCERDRDNRSCRQRPLNNSNNNTSGVIWSKLQRVVRSLCSQWHEARKLARQAVVQSYHSHSTMVSRNGCSGSQYAVQTQLLKLNPVLGVSPRGDIAPSSESCAGAAGFSGTGAGAGGTVASLDLARVTSLQRELVEFSSKSFEFLRTVTPEDFRAQQCSGGGSSGSVSLEKLQLQSQILVLHLAFLAPLCPIQCQNSVLASSSSGLDILIAEASKSQGKVCAQRVQQASDRARAEQLALIRCLQATQDCLTKWPAAAASHIKMLQQLNKKVTSLFERGMADITGLEHALHALTTAWAAMEASRVASPRSAPPLASAALASGDDSGLVSPVEVLSKGFLGPQSANVINVLSLHKADFTNVLVTLKELRRNLEAEMRQELSALHAASEFFRKAIDVTVHYLEMPQLQHGSPDILISSESSPMIGSGSGNISSIKIAKQKPASVKSTKSQKLMERPPFDTTSTPR